MNVEMPDSCKQGEQIGIRVTVFNYMCSSVEAVVVLSGSESFKFVHVEEDGIVRKIIIIIGVYVCLIVFFVFRLTLITLEHLMVIINFSFILNHRMHKLFISPWYLQNLIILVLLLRLLL